MSKNFNNPQWLILVHNSKFYTLEFPFSQLSYRLKHQDIPRSIVLANRYLQLTEQEAIIVINLIINLEYLNLIIQIIEKYKIKKIYFFIFDILRIRHPNTVSPLDRVILEQYPCDVRADELDLIQFISKSCNIDVEVYHNESNSGIFENLYKFPIKYYDLYSVDYGSTWTRRRFINSHNFKHKLCCFNRRHEIYRSCIAALLYNQDSVFLTLGHRYRLESLVQNTILPLNKFSLEIHDKIVSGYTDILTNNIELSWDSSYKPDVFDRAFSHHLELKNNVVCIQDSFLSLVTETTFCSIMPNFSEKTLDPISVYRPFILMAAPNTLKLLQDLGFKTFDPWWDESYDSILDHTKRFEAIYYLVENILEKDISELTQILKEMNEVLEHNQKNMMQLNKKMFEINELDRSA
jgi:hypothetical protein